MGMQEGVVWARGREEAREAGKDHIYQTLEAMTSIVKVPKDFQKENAMTQFLFQKDPSGCAMKN